MFGNDHDEVFLGRDFNSTPSYSDEVAARIDAEVKHIVDEAYQRCESILRTHIDKLHEVARILFEREKIDADEFKTIMDQPSAAADGTRVRIRPFEFIKTQNMKREETNNDHYQRHKHR